MAVQRFCKPKVGGSNPSSGTNTIKRATRLPRPGSALTVIPPGSLRTTKSEPFSTSLRALHHISENSENGPAAKRDAFGCGVVRPKGIEPLTPDLEGPCSIQLSYRRVVETMTDLGAAVLPRSSA